MLGNSNCADGPDNFDNLQIQWTGLPAPTNLQATQISSGGIEGVNAPPTEIKLTWNYGDTNSIDGFAIQRKMISGNSSKAAPINLALSDAGCSGTTGNSQQTCTYYIDSDITLENFATYIYRVSANQGANSSSYSNIAAGYQLVKYLINETTANRPTIDTYFTPDPDTIDCIECCRNLSGPDNLSLSTRYDHFNWISSVEHEPDCYIRGLLVPIFRCKAMHNFRRILTFRLGATTNMPLFEWQNCGPDQIEQCKGSSDGLIYYWNENRTTSKWPTHSY